MRRPPSTLEEAPVERSLALCQGPQVPATATHAPAVRLSLRASARKRSARRQSRLLVKKYVKSECSQGGWVRVTGTSWSEAGADQSSAVALRLRIAESGEFCRCAAKKVIYLYFQHPDVPPPARRFRQGDSGPARGPPAHTVRRAAVRNDGAPAPLVSVSTNFPNNHG